MPKKLQTPIAIVLALMLYGCGDPKTPVADPDTTRQENKGPEQGAQQETSPSCGIPVVSGSGLGNLTVGSNLEVIKKNCIVLSDTIEIRAEGMPARIIEVQFGSDAVEAEVVKEKIWRINISNPRFSTMDSIHVGTPIRDLADLPNVRTMAGEGALFVVSSAHCGLSFRLSGPFPPGATDMDRIALKELQESTTVSRILVFGCK